jgi:hypothetical protein
MTIKIEQVAIHVPDVDEYTKRLGDTFGLDQWVFDDVVGNVSLHSQGIRHVSCARLGFNYQLGYEFELLHYVSGPNWHEDRKVDMTKPFMSHKGCHVDDIDAAIAHWQGKGLKIIQTMHTTSHSNPYLIEQKRTFKYAIFDTKDQLGFDYKLIQRIQPKATPKVSDIALGLENAAETFRKRSEEYGSNFLNMGEAMAGMFPNGVTLQSPEDFVRWHLFELNMIKMSRYASNWDKGGHADSLVDACVYPAMLAWVDECIRKDNLP